MKESKGKDACEVCLVMIIKDSVIQEEKQKATHINEQIDVVKKEMLESETQI